MHFIMAISASHFFQTKYTYLRMLCSKRIFFLTKKLKETLSYHHNKLEVCCKNILLSHNHSLHLFPILSPPLTHHPSHSTMTLCLPWFHTHLHLRLSLLCYNQFLLIQPHLPNCHSQILWVIFHLVTLYPCPTLTITLHPPTPNHVH